MMRMNKALSALDADENNTIDEAEIKGAVAALKKLDANSDGKLTDDEAGMKSMSPPNTGAAYSSAIAIDFGSMCQKELRHLTALFIGIYPRKNAITNPVQGVCQCRLSILKGDFGIGQSRVLGQCGLNASQVYFFNQGDHMVCLIFLK